MANSPPLFVVDDTSPTILYFPFGDTLSIPNFTAGWNPLFNQTSFGGVPLEVENSTTVHITSLNNASFSYKWKGTGIQLAGYTTDASYTILLDGFPRDANSTKTLLASIQNLDNVDHEISLTTNISDTTQNQTSSFLVFDKATILAPPASDNTTVDTLFTPQSLNDSGISFSGEWNFQNSSGNGLSPVYISNNPGDSAFVKFNGTALQIYGTVSPQGGNYTVKLDNVTTQFSANASFTQNDTLLFFASALNTNVAHDVQILNNGGTLILPFNGFVVFSSGDPNIPSTGNTPGAASPGGNLSSGSLPKGTIAALVLAGILAFLLISGLLFFFFVWRPMKIKHRQALRERYMLERDASGGDAVLNIGQHTPSYASNNSPTGSRRTRGSQRSSGRSGFLRWKREMESTDGGNVLGALGLIFRHSYSPKDKPPSHLDDDNLYDDGSGSRKSSNFSFRSPAQSPGSKGKSRWTGKSKQDVPSFTIDLPPLNLSQEHFKSEIPALLPLATAPTPVSDFTSLTYMSTPDTRNFRELSFNAPFSHLPNTSRPQHPAASPDYGKTDSNGALLIRDGFDRSNKSESEVDFRSSLVSSRQEPDLQVHVQEFEVQSTNATFSSRRSGSRTTASMYAREMDRGSVRTNDDGLSMLGPATARAAIRSLSPRTSELAFTHLGLDQPVPSASHPADVARSPRERLVSDETLRPQSQNPLAEVDLARHDRRKTVESASRKSARLSVRFEDDADRLTLSSKNQSAELTDDRLLVPPGRLEVPRAAFRLTPQRPVTSTSPISEADSKVATSFLDLSGSNSHSNSDSSQKEPSLASQGQGLKSRWSATTGTDLGSHNLRQESSDSQNSGGSTSSPSSNFPFPVSLPASPHHPEGFKPSPPVTPSLGTYQTLAPGRLNIHPHPFGIAMNPASPSDSVPISISDLHFRHSDSENDELITDSTADPGSHLPPHPPLPSIPPTPTSPPPYNAPSHIAPPTSPTLSSPSYIVSRVFPHSRSNSAIDPQSPSAHRTAGSS
ncbi:hypothetical protein C8J55DRAFT_485130 [Lentinula edodes]|uniref:Uncharacterized protein n=1 Tax=Lentinula lateritia TaxID=40482 RepID=A0A9W9AYU7_9AGAR|nr:hypothetical protein C8J55DRAFT_485130 [Lentinula edodes]